MRNVVLFGESGVGKSSIINMIMGREVAKYHNGPHGCTLDATPYTITLDSRINVQLWDTVGLDEGSAGTTIAAESKRKLKQLLQGELAVPGGIDLLIYCIRVGRIKDAHLERYKFVYEEVCKKAVPVALVVTGLETYPPERDMDSWWSVNVGDIQKLGLWFCAHACITALPKSQYGDGDDLRQFDISQQRLRDLLKGEFHAPRNVVVFGEPYTERTTLINKITGGHTPPRLSHGSSKIPPFEWNHVAVPQDNLNLWSVAGLDESDDGVSAPLVEKNLKPLLQEINQTPGIDLLVFCMRAGRVKFTHVRNYNVFYAAICRKKVPVVLVVLGPSADEDTWWRGNEGGLREKGMRFEKHVYVPCSTSSGQPLPSNDATRRLVNLMKERYTPGAWKVGNDVFGMAAPDVRAVVGELWTLEHRPTPTIAICDMTRQEALVDIAPGVQPSWRSTTGLIKNLEYRFQHVDPHSFTNAGSPETQSRVLEPGTKGICLLMFFVPATATEEAWRTLPQFYSAYRGDVIPLIIVVQGLPGKKDAEDAWKAAPRDIQRRISAHLTYHPGPDASPQAQATAKDILMDMIEDRCLVGFGAKAVVLQGILSYWKRYRSGRGRDSTGRD
ncbi:hypothetical protein BDN67DRAFT_1011575 [Paxillus ammoniavirescens]|nr:hypothetical protein BDN67DRAFT_1011575 [Paxillus ammoniavirescens]